MPDTDNGRITLAILSEKLNTIERKLDEIGRVVNADHDCITSMTQRNKEVDKRLDEHENDIETLKRSSNTWNGINTALAIAGSTIAAWLGLRSN